MDKRMQHTVNNMLKRLHLKKEPPESDARQRLKKELFAFNYCVEHGFPSKPTAVAYDSILQLLAIGTKAGNIRIYGAPGVEFSGQHSSYIAVCQIHFIPLQGRLITLCSDDSLHLWQIDLSEDKTSSVLTLIRSFTLEISKLKKVYASCLTSDGTQLLLGTEGGTVHSVDVSTFKLSMSVCHRDAIIQNASQEFKVTPGPIDCLVSHPALSNQVLIGYGRGLIVQWDCSQHKPVKTYHTTQAIESLRFSRDGREFISAHADGSYNIWASDARSPDQPTTPYGPFPCKAISKIDWKTTAQRDPIIIFSGGMPRASHGDKHTVTVMQGQKHVVFDFMSKFIDFLLLSSFDPSDTQHSHDDPHTLLVLTEEELVAIDLLSPDWPTFSLPYLNSIHSSAITSASHIAAVPDKFWKLITDLGKTQAVGNSKRAWPIQGGRSLAKQPINRDLLLTGHEDGSVCFWDVTTVSMSLLYKLRTAPLFGVTSPAVPDGHNVDGDEEWPPFRKVGTFDPYSDDPQLGIQKIVLCCHSDVLVLGGTAGQVIVLEFVPREALKQIPVGSLNLMEGNDCYVWKGHDSLPVHGGDILFPPGFHPKTVVQVSPPAMCTTLAVHATWQLFAIGTAHGYGLYDFMQNKPVFSRCTLAVPGEENSGGFPTSPKAFRKSLRESFRQLRKKRIPALRRRLSNASQRVSEHPLVRRLSQRNSQSMDSRMNETRHSAASHDETIPKEPANSTAAPPSPGTGPPAPASPQEGSPPESPSNKNDVSANELTTSHVRSLYLAETFLTSGQEHAPTMWVGTNGGRVYAHQIVVPAGEKRKSETVTCVLAKEIHLKHKAAVIGLCVVDRTVQPVSGLCDVQHERTKAADMTGGHQVIVCSEQQVKIFSLPSLIAVNKFKLSSSDPSRIRKAAVVNFTSKSDENYVERDLVYLTQAGDLNVLSLPHLRPQLSTSQIKLDSSSINACVLTINGEGFFLSSPSEFARLSFSTMRVRKPMCVLPLKDGARPVLKLDQSVTSSVSRQTSAASERGAVVRSVHTNSHNGETSRPTSVQESGRRGDDLGSAAASRSSNGVQMDNGAHAHAEDDVMAAGPDHPSTARTAVTTTHDGQVTREAVTRMEERTNEFEMMDEENDEDEDNEEEEDVVVDNTGEMEVADGNVEEGAVSHVQQKEVEPRPAARPVANTEI